MAFVLEKDNVCKQIAEALGIKHCRKLDIRMRSDEIVTIEAEFFPEIDSVKQLKPIFKKYYLVEKKPLKDIAKTEPPIGIDGESINFMKEYGGTDVDYCPPPKKFINEQDLK